MAMIAVSCPHCGRKGKAPPETIGRVIKCPKCGQPWKVLANSSALPLAPVVSIQPASLASVVTAPAVPAVLRSGPPPRPFATTGVNWLALGVIGGSAAAVVAVLAIFLVVLFSGARDEQQPGTVQRVAVAASQPATTPASAVQSAPDLAPAKSEDKPKGPTPAPAVEPATKSELQPTKKDNPGEVVRAYLEQKQWEGRLAFVIDQAANRPLMEARYGGLVPPNFRSISVQPPERKTTPREWYFVRATWVDTFNRPAVGEFVVRKVGENYKIDWPATVGANATPLKTFMALTPQAAARFRVNAKLSSYYNYEYRNTNNSHYSFELSDAHPYANLHGYVPKSSPEGRQLFELLKRGQARRIIVELQFLGPDGQQLERGDHGVACLTSLVSETWVEN